MEAKIEDGKLKIEIPMMEPAKPSKSGKMLLLASTGGNQPTDLHIGKQRVYLSLTAYYYPEDLNHD
jgi:hypothetical protein